MLTQGAFEAYSPVSGELDRRLRAIAAEIKSLSAEDVTEDKQEELAERLLAEQFGPVSVNLDDRAASRVEEHVSPKAGNFSTRTKVRYHIPTDGNIEILKFHPGSPHTEQLQPRVSLKTQYNSAREWTAELTYDVGTDMQPQEHNGIASATAVKIGELVSETNAQLATARSESRATVMEAISARRDELTRRNDVLANLDVPLRQPKRRD